MVDQYSNYVMPETNETVSTLIKQRSDLTRFMGQYGLTHFYVMMTRKLV